VAMVVVVCYCDAVGKLQFEQLILCHQKRQLRLRKKYQ